MKSLLLRQKTAAILLLLRDNSQKWYSAKLAKLSGASYIYVAGVLSKFHEAGWVEPKKEGRTKYFALTESGAAVASALDALAKKLEQKKEEAPSTSVSAAKTESPASTPAQKAA
jgi:predicted transcriptional regulator